MNNQQFIERARKRHGDKFDYSLVDCQTLRSTVLIICPKHGKFEQKAGIHLQSKYGCQKCGKSIADKHHQKSLSNFLEKSKEKHGSRYDYSKSTYVDSKTKITITCKLHGDFEVLPSRHFSKNKPGNCPKCARISIKDQLVASREEFIEKSRQSQKNECDYSISKYTGSGKKVEIICPEHGKFEQFASAHCRGIVGCRRCGASKCQNDLENTISKLGVSIITEDRKAISPYEIDILIPDYNIGIECNGIYYHSYNRPELHKEKYKHKTKCDLAAANNIMLLQFTDQEVIGNIDLIISMIKSKIGMSNRIFARKCVIKKISNKESIDFLNNNHMHGYRSAKIVYGMWFSSKLVAVFSLSPHKKHQWEIIRTAYDRDCVIVGGLDKMIKRFVTDYKPISIMTYADRRFSQGMSYIRSGFKLIDQTRPNYQYIKSNSVYNRIQYQKHKLKEKLDKFDPNKTEAENMFMNGFRRIWDAGHNKLLLGTLDSV